MQEKFPSQELPMADTATEEKYLSLLEDFLYGAGKGLSETEVSDLKDQMAEIKSKYQFSDDFQKNIAMTVERIHNE